MNTKLFYTNTLATAKKINLINKLGGKCSICEESRHWMLEFHHEGDKEFGIGTMRTYRLSKLEKEAEKCICVCANCHRKLHMSSNETKYSKSKIKMLEYKNTNCCSRCGYSELNSALEFHHIDPNTKLMRISEYRGSEINLSDEIKTELDKCVVLCANCHSEEHYDLKFFEANKDYILNKSRNIKELQPELDKQEVLRLYESGMKPIEIARHYKASKGTISGILKSFGKTKTMNDIKIDRDEFKQFVLAGNNSKKIQAKFNINRTTIFSLCKELNIKITKMENDDPDNGRFQKRKCNLSDEQLIELLKTKTKSEIAREFKVSPAAITLRIKNIKN